MAAIGKIRKHSGLLLITIGLAMLAFIISDAFNNNSMLFRGSQDEVGEIAGEPIRYKEFDARYQQLMEQIKSQSPDNVMDDATRASLVEQAWNQLVISKAVDEELGALGIDVTPAELADAITGPQPHPQIVQAFTDPQTGQFKRENLIGFLKTIDQQPVEIQRSWRQFEEQLFSQLRQQRLLGLIAKSFYITSAEARDYYEAQNFTVDGRYVWASVMEIPDSLAQPSEEDMRLAYAQYKERFKQKPGRTIDYVIFPIVPTREDTAAFLKEFEQLKADWQQEADDSAFVAAVSEEPWDTTWRPPTNFDPELVSLLWGSQPGVVVGPVFRNGKWVLFKVTAFRPSDDVYYRASHILIQRGADSAAALAKAKEILREVQAGAPFDSLARIYGTDATRERGGDLGWFDADAMVGPFGKAVRSAKLGKPFMVHTQFGYHVVVVYDTLQRDAHVAAVVRSVTPSSATYDEVYREAVAFHSALEQGEDFKDAAIAAGKTPLIAEQVQPSDVSLPGLGYARPVIRFAYNADEEGAVSDILDIPGYYVVARLTGISENPYKPFEDVRKEELMPLAVMVKKRKILAEKFQQVKGASLEEVAKALGKTVSEAAAVRLIPPVVAGIGSEPAVAGYFVGLPVNKAYWPIEGEMGVAAVMPTQQHAVEMQSEEVLNTYRTQLLTAYAPYWQQRFLEGLKDILEVEDYKYKFY